MAKDFKPHLIIAGISSYTRYLDYAKFRQVADDNNSYLHADMSHISGLVAAQLCPSPFEYADTVMTTTHKTFRGPRAAIIFYRKGKKVNRSGVYDFETKINNAVFPGLQGGPHNQTIAAIATAALQAQSDDFKLYQTKVIKNARLIADKLLLKGYELVTGGTDIHMVVIDLRTKGVTGDKVATLLESVSIACNKNIIPGDSDPHRYSGIRIGTPALTSRGLTEVDFQKVIEFLDEGICLSKESADFISGGLIDFKNFIETNEHIRKKILNLRERVERFIINFSLPGLPDL